MKHLPLVIMLALFVIFSVAFALREMGNQVRTHRLDMEVTTLLPPLVHLVTTYTDAHRVTGVWPEPGTVYDDSMMPFIASRLEGGDRIDTYGTLIDRRRIDIVLKADGSIQAWSVGESD